MKVSGGARAAAGLGDAKAGQLDEDGARQARLQAVTLPLRPSGALLAGEVDAFDDPRGCDPRAAAYRRLGDASFAIGRIDDARSMYWKAVETDAFDAESVAALFRVEAAQNDISSAEVHVKQARNLLTSANDKGGPGEPPPLVRGATTARVLLAEALFWKAKGDQMTAEKTIDASLSADAQVAGAYAYALKGKILKDRSDARADGEFKRALELEESAKDLTARFYAQAKSQVVAAAKSGDAATIQKARAAVGAVLALRPQHAHALYLRGRLDVLGKKWDEALKDFTDALDQNPCFRDAYIARGFLLVRDLPDERRDEQAGEKARSDFSLAIQYDEAKGDGFYGLALVYWRKGDTNHTLENVEKAINLAPKWAPPYLLRSDVNRQNNKDAAADADKKKYEELNKLGEQP
jgi:tetratricopeptide (TPR) repeat protein